MEEIWKDIPNYEGLYQASNLGRIKSIGKIVNGSNQFGVNFKYLKKDKILKPIINNHNYLQVSLYKNNKKAEIRVHQLIAQTFLPNFNNYKIINHKDGNKHNNHVDNLEFCTQSHNVLESYRLGLQTPIVKKVNQYDLNGKFIKMWSSINSARKYYNNSHISDCCKGNRKTAGGYIWRYAN